MGDSNIASLTHFLSILISYVHLFLASIHSHPIMQNLQKLELGKFAFQVGITTAVGLRFSPAAEDHSFLAHAFMIACALLWTGMLLGTIHPRLGSILQILPATLIMCFLCLLPALFHPIAYFSPSWLSAAIVLLPLAYIFIKPKATADQTMVMVDA